MGLPFEDVETAQRYGTAHPGVFGGMCADDDRLRIGLTVLEPYADELQAQMQQPERVDIVLVEYTEIQLATLQDEVMHRAQAAGVFQGCGRGFQRVDVRLRPDGVDHARELHDEFGDRLTITVGRRRYPPTGDVEEPKAAPRSTMNIPGLTMHTVLDVTEVVPGAYYRGQVVLRNTGIDTITLSTDQPLVASLVDSDGHVAGVFTGAIAGTGLRLNLPPGDEHRIRILGGTAGSAEHYATPPGSYAVVVVIPLRGCGARGQLVTPPSPLRVV